MHCIFKCTSTNVYHQLSGSGVRRTDSFSTSTNMLFLPQPNCTSCAPRAAGEIEDDLRPNRRRRDGAEFGTTAVSGYIPFLSLPGHIVWSKVIHSTVKCFLAVFPHIPHMLANVPNHANNWR